MAVHTIGVTIDCNDIVRVAAFWRDALGYEEASPPAPDATFHGLGLPPGDRGLHHVTLQRVAEPKSAKTRAHLDLFVQTDLGREVERLVDLGASVVVPPASDGQFTTAVLQDPEGTEFCVVRRSTSLCSD